jgi:hypothetical protein
VLNQTQAGSLRAQLMVDIAAGEIEVFSLTLDHFASAEKLIGRHSFFRRLRTLDALQLAVALELVEEGLVDTFVAADKIRCFAKPPLSRGF